MEYWGLDYDDLPVCCWNTIQQRKDQVATMQEVQKLLFPEMCSKVPRPDPWAEVPENTKRWKKPIYEFMHKKQSRLTASKVRHLSDS